MVVLVVLIILIVFVFLEVIDAQIGYHYNKKYENMSGTDVSDDKTDQLPKQKDLKDLKH